MSMSSQPVVRIITSHAPVNQHGEPGVVVNRIVTPVTNLLGDEVKGATVWATGVSPAINSYEYDQDDAELAAGQLVVPHGTNCRITDMAPHAYAPMHRTSSVDYNIMLSGSAWLETPSIEDPENLDKVVRTEVKAGEIVVQRGTLHAWRAGAEGARWASVLVYALPVEVPGLQKTLEDKLL